MGARVGSRSRPSIFLGPLEISGYYGNLERGFCDLGIKARLVTLHPHPFDFVQAQRNPWPARFARRAVLFHRKAAAPLKLLTGSLYVLACVLVLLWSLPRFDSYIFTWGQSLLPRNLDLPLLHFLRKNITMVVGHGSEARPPYMATAPAGAPPFTAEILASLKAETAAIAGKIQRIERWADNVLGLPTTGQFFESPFINFYSVGLPTPAPSDSQSAENEVVAVSGDIVIVHVPSKPEVKGTIFIRECMEEIVAKYPHVSYVELTSRPHAEVLAAIGRSTFVIDQLWSDIPMAIVGTEAASLGKATVIAGYAWDTWRATLAQEEWPPTVVTAPEDLLETIESCVVDIDSIRELGSRAREFVAAKWSCSSVAENYLRVLRGETPPNWIVNPSEISYGYGCGVPRQIVDEMVSELVAVYGVGVLDWPRATEVYGIGKH